jgi:DNA invertase Pin-like site-specific DNA recombinase
MVDEAMLKGRVALVTGSGRGMGSAHSAILTQHGADVVVHDIVPERVAESAAVVRQHGRRVMEAATTRKIDVVAAWSIDRLGRSLQDLVNFLAELDAVGCDLYLERQSVDTTTPAGRALFQMLGVFAEFEREIIRERIHAGLARARKFGTKSGKPIGHAPLPRAKVDAIRAELAKGTGIIKTARLCSTGVSVVQRIKREVAANS